MNDKTSIKDIPGWKEAIKEAKNIVLAVDSIGLDCGGDNDCSFGVVSIETVPSNFQEASAILGKALELLLISKNKKYGKGNILNSKDFGMDPKQGLGLRMNDKFERLKNGLKGTDLGVEGFIDTFGDLVGYAAIGIMLEKDWYKLPIMEE